MFIQEAYDILREEPEIEDFDKRVVRLVEISGQDRPFVQDFLRREAGISDRIAVKSDES